MHHDTYLPPATEHVSIPDDALMDSRVTDTDPGEVLLELDMIGSDSRRLVIVMSGTVRDVRADLDTLRASLDGASRRLEGREHLAEYGLGGL